MGTRLLWRAVQVFTAVFWAAALGGRAEAALPYPQGTAFPLMMYEVEPSSTAPSNTIYGWNVLQAYGLTTNSQINAFLQVALSNNAAGDAIIPYTTDTNGDGVELPQAQIETWIQGLDTNANIAWWDLPEEMRPWVASELQLLNDYTAWTRLYDPGKRPTYEYTPNDRTDAEISETAPAVDELGISCYCEYMGLPHAWVRYKLQQSGVNGLALAGETAGSNYLAGQKTLIAVLYCATNSNYPGVIPTPQESYHDVWSAIASGAQGIALYSYYHAIHDTPALATNLQQFNLAATQLSGPEQIGQVVLYGVPHTNVNFTVTSGPATTVTFSPPGATNVSYPSLNTLCKAWSNKIYLIAVNSTSNTVSAIISNLPAASGTAALPFENNSVNFSNATISATFPPWGVHIYQITPPAPAISSIALAGGKATLTFPALANFSYILQSSTNLVTGLSWTNLNTNIAPASGMLSFTNITSGNGVYYRLRVP